VRRSFSPFPSRTLAVAEVQVLDPQADALHQPQPRPVEQPCHQPVGPAHLRHYEVGLFAGEHDGDARRPLGPLDTLDVGQLYPEHFSVEEEERRERLILTRGGDTAVCSEVREELADLGRTHLGGVALAVEEYEALDPVDVGALGADAIMLEPQAPPNLLKQRRSFCHGVLRVLRTVLGGMPSIMRRGVGKSQEITS
jgi:hypothetical protein